MYGFEVNLGCSKEIIRDNPEFRPLHYVGIIQISHHVGVT